MRTSISRLLFVVGLAIFVGSSGLSWAQPITITLSFDKEYYELGEPVMVTVTVKNENGSLYISKGFSVPDYYLKMRIIDPGGRVLLLKPENVEPPPEELEIPDAPPMPFVLDTDGSTVRTAPCERLDAGKEITVGPVDLRNYYPLKFPGKYSAQVQLSAMIFNRPPAGNSEDQCRLKDTDVSKVLKSSTYYVYMKGSTQVHVAPNQWKLRWWDGMDLPPYIEVQITPEPGKTVNNYGVDKNYYRLNNVPAERVKRTDTIVQAFFPPEAAIKSLGPSKGAIDFKGVYDVVVLGTLVDGNENIVGMFGGGDKIRIVND